MVHYRFAHDRVQQAAYSLISEAERRTVHLQIGRLLLRAAGEQPHSEQIFEIVAHLNRGGLLIEDSEERIQVARLNLDAASRAREATAYQAARSSTPAMVFRCWLAHWLARSWKSCALR